MKKLLFFIVLLCAMASVQAITMYVSGAGRVPLYHRADKMAAIVAQLPKKMPVTVLKTNLANGFSYIKTADDQQGWMQTQYLLSRPQNQHDNYFQRTWHHVVNWFEPNQSAAKQQGVSQQQATVSAPAMRPVSNSTLSLKDQVAKLEARVSRLESRQHASFFWFFWGAVIAILAMLIGRMLGRANNRKRSLFK